MSSATITKVTWDETYKAEIGSVRLVSSGKRIFRRQSDVDRFISVLNSPDTLRFSMFAGRQNKIENIQITENMATGK